MIQAYYKSRNHDFNLLHGDTFELLPWIKATGIKACRRRRLMPLT